MSTLRISERNWRSFLLDYRMAALDLDPIEISALVPQTFNKLQRVCSSCEKSSRCARDLAGDTADAAWKHYCPNSIDLLMIDLLLRAARASGKPVQVLRSKVTARSPTTRIGGSGNC